MTDYNGIVDTETDPSAPLKSSLFKRIVANPIAVTEGANGAPRIVGAAIKRLADMPVLTVSAADVVNALILCDIVDGVTSTSGTSFVAAQTITVRRATGSLRFYGNHDNREATGLSVLSITKNGTEVTSWSSGSSTPQLRSVDISVVPNDVIQWRVRRDGGSGTVNGRAHTINASNSYIQRPAYLTFLNRDVI